MAEPQHRRNDRAQRNNGKDRARNAARGIDKHASRGEQTGEATLARARRATARVPYSARLHRAPSLQNSLQHRRKSALLT
eukprot:969634-Lingulodinium_polyedra.AAC.1